MKFKYLSIIIILFSFMSCDKDAEENKIDNKPLSAIEQKIIKFKTDLTSSQKDGQVYGISEAEWYLEGLLNYEEANNEHTCNQLSFVNNVYQVPVTNGTISSVDLLSAYNHFLEIIVACTQEETIFSDVIDLNIVAATKDGDAIIEMNYSYGSMIPLLHYDLFPVNDDWLLADDWGACGNNSSSESSSAELELEYKFNHPNTVSQTEDGYYINVITTQPIMPRDFDEDLNNPAKDQGRTRIIADNCEVSTCLHYNELNFYLSKFDFIKEISVPSNKTFISVDVYSTTWMKGDWFHYYEIKYGDFVLNSGGQQ